VAEREEPLRQRAIPEEVVERREEDAAGRCGTVDLGVSAWLAVGSIPGSTRTRLTPTPSKMFSRPWVLSWKRLCSPQAFRPR
jgi:hypothetical protein